MNIAHYICFLACLSAAMVSNLTLKNKNWKNAFSFTSVDMFLGFSMNNIQSNSIDESVQMGNFIRIEPGVVIKAGSSVQDYAVIEQNSQFDGDDSIGSFVHIGQRCSFGSGVKLNQYAKTGNNAKIGDGCVLDQYSSLGDNVRLSQNVYVGKRSSVLTQNIVGESAVILNYVEIGVGVTVAPRQVYMRAPHSHELYQSCEPNVPSDK